MGTRREGADDSTSRGIKVDSIAFLVVLFVEVVIKCGVEFTCTDVVELVCDGAPAVLACASFVDGLVEAGL